MRGVILYSDEFRFQTDFNLSDDRVSSKLRVTEKLCFIDLSHLQFIYIYIDIYISIYLSIYLSLYIYIYILRIWAVSAWWKFLHKQHNACGGDGGDLLHE